ncbi:MAG: DUF6391 domain-containing protein [Dethiobacteria bacterium]|jgi:hypothetical protein
MPAFLFIFILLPVLLFLFISLLFLPFRFAIYSLLNIFTIPVLLVKIVINPKLRANHALEHATINVMEENFGCLNLSGQGEENGFVIQGAVDPHHLINAARVGLSRLKNGEKNLAIHRRCGTSILAANLLSSILIVYLLWSIGYFGFFYILLALFVAQLFGPALGVLLQKFVTTSTRVDNYEIVGIEGATIFSGGFVTPAGQRYFIRTRQYGN